MGERRIKPKFNIYESYKKMNISNPYRFKVPSIIPVSNIVAYYDMQDNVLDKKATNHGTATGITYNQSSVGKAAVFSNGSGISIPQNESFTFGNGSADTPFSVVFMVKRTSEPTSNGYWFINKRDNTTSAQEWQIFEYSGVLQVTLFSNSSGSNTLGIKTNLNPFTLNTTETVTLTYDGSGNYTGLKFYLNDTLLSSSDFSTGNYVAMKSTTSGVTIGKRGFGSAGYVKGNIDEVSIFNKELTEAEVSAVISKFQEGQSLI
jgi:hypothetical protein